MLTICSTLILNYITAALLVPLHLTEKYNFLGISIVGQSNERGDGGIYIGSIMKGGAVAADGRIEPGDMLLQVCVFVCVVGEGGLRQRESGHT